MHEAVKDNKQNKNRMGRKERLHNMRIFLIHLHIKIQFDIKNPQGKS